MKKILVALLVLGLAAPAMAADFDFYGSFRTHLGYYDVDQEFGIGHGRDDSLGTHLDDDSGMALSLGGNSTFGANIGVSENIYGKIETGLEEPGNDVYLRQMFGVWNFGEGSLLAGKTYTPASFLGYSKQSGNTGAGYDTVLLPAGIPYIGRQPQVRLTFGGFQFALIEANTGVEEPAQTGITDSYAAGEGYDKDFMLPRMEAAYTFNMDPVTLQGIAGYQSYNVSYYQLDAAGEWQEEGDEDIDSYHVGLGVKADFDPAYVNAGISYGQNRGNYGNSNLLLRAPTGAESDVVFAQVVDGSIEDATLLEGLLVAGFRVSPMLNLEAGMGYMSGEVDIAANNTAEQTSMMYYAQAWISMNETFHIVPEIGMIDRGDIEYDEGDDTENGSMTYLDVSFRYEF